MAPSSTQKVVQEPREFTDKLQNLYNDFRQNQDGERQKVSGSPEQQTNVAKETLELYQQKPSPLQRRDVSPSNMSLSSTQKQQQPVVQHPDEGYMIEGQYFSS